MAPDYRRLPAAPPPSSLTRDVLSGMSFTTLADDAPPFPPSSEPPSESLPPRGWRRRTPPVPSAAATYSRSIRTSVR